MIKEGEAGAMGLAICRKYGVREATCYAGKSKCAGFTVSESKRLKALEEEDRQLKQILAEPTLDRRALKELLSKNC